MRVIVLVVLAAALGNASTFAEETLAEQLEAKSAAFAARAPEQMRKVFQQGIDDVAALGLVESAKQVGDDAVDAELTAWNGDKVQLSKLWGEGPVVLIWYRGGWCPYCNLQLRATQESLAELDEAGARLVALTPELPDNAKQTAEANELSFLVLHDADNNVARQYGIVFELPEVIAPMYRDRLKLAEVNGTDKLELPLAATYVIGTDGKIKWAFLDNDYKKRAEPADVVEAVKSIK